MKWLAPALVIVVAVLAELTLGGASGGPDFALFFGRFHPLVVHLPIGFFLLVAIGEAATFVPALRNRVEPALGLLLPLSAVAALGAFLMGQLLALEGGFPTGALGWHRRLTLCAIIGMSVCWVLYERQRAQGGQGRWAYRGAMTAALGLLSLGAHFGGTMTRGENYLSKYAPGPLKPLLGASAAKPASSQGPNKASEPVAEPLIYQDVLQPIFKQHCVECHGLEKQKAKLRLDSLAELLKGGENGAVLVAGAPKKSSLLARMLLPLSDDEHMPPEGNVGPKPEELALIEFWIERGASPTLKVRDSLAPSVSRSLLEHALGGVPPSDVVPVSAGNAAPATEPVPSAFGAVPPLAPARTAEPATAVRSNTVDGASEPTGTVAAAAVTPEPALASTSTAGATSGPAFLAAHCEKCHGAQKQKGKLRVDSVAALLQGGANGTVLVPGSPDRSPIFKRVRLALGDEEHMPPKKEPQPGGAEVAVLAAWIRAGAGASSAQAVTSAAAAKSAAAPSTVAVATNTGAVTDTGSMAVPPADGSAVALPPPEPAQRDAGTNATNAPAAVSGPAELAQSLPAEVALFAEVVQPLFREKCGKCHIKDQPAGGLGVAEHAQLLAGGYSGAGIVPKNRKASVVLQRLVLPSADSDHMPPEGEPTLSADEVELVGAWIDHGAPATSLTETAKLTAGAARALSAHGVKGSGPPPLGTQAGGCAACSVPGAPQSRGLGLQALGLVGVATLLAARRRTRA